MIRLIKIELYKLYPNRFFKILGILWILAFISIPTSVYYFLDWINKEKPFGKEVMISPSEWPIFDFVDIWQNMAYLYKMITIFLCFIVVISIINDLDYKTIRQNIIDGMSRTEFWKSKVSFLLGISAVAALLLFIVGLVLGFFYSSVTAPEYIFKKIQFVGAYFIQVFYFLMFCFTVSLLIKRAGFTFISILFWIYVFEPIAYAIIREFYYLPKLAQLLPMESGWNLIPLPFEKYFMKYSQDFVSFNDLSIALIWLGVFLLSSFLLIKKRDL